MYTLTSSSFFRKIVVQTFFFENEMTLTTLSRNLMIFYHFPHRNRENEVLRKSLN